MQVGKQGLVWEEEHRENEGLPPILLHTSQAHEPPQHAMSCGGSLYIFSHLGENTFLREACYDGPTHRQWLICILPSLLSEEQLESVNAKRNANTLQRD